MLNNTQFLDLMKSYMNLQFYMSSMKNIPAVDLSSINKYNAKSCEYRFND